MKASPAPLCRVIPRFAICDPSGIPAFTFICCIIEERSKTVLLGSTACASRHLQKHWRFQHGESPLSPLLCDVMMSFFAISYETLTSAHQPCWQSEMQLSTYLCACSFAAKSDLRLVGVTARQPVCAGGLCVKH